MRLTCALALAVPLSVCPLLSALSSAHAQLVVGISVSIVPPALPVYVQPPIPAPGYLWIPGYWAWGHDLGYYWVPGTWILPPQPGLLWTPGYWAWSDGVYVFHTGYWGPHIGFYGGVAYGFGYTGVGYEGGYWRNGSFFYNRSVNSITSVSITNVFNKTVVVNNVTNVSYNGGAGGTTAKATPEELAAEREPHVAPTPEQTRHAQAAAKDPSLSLAQNHGQPAVAATMHPAQFKGLGVVAARPGKPVAVLSPKGPAGKGGANSPGNMSPGGTATIGATNKVDSDAPTPHEGGPNASGPAAAMKKLSPSGAEPTPQTAKPVLPPTQLAKQPANPASKPQPARRPPPPRQPKCAPGEQCR
ncbi:MAG TPA: hypothetical protein VGJ20_10365 [Xanthobacteraceae bacterium]|jgi:hypothetical protein